MWASNEGERSEVVREGGWGQCFHFLLFILTWRGKAAFPAVKPHQHPYVIDLKEKLKNRNFPKNYSF